MTFLNKIKHVSNTNTLVYVLLIALVLIFVDIALVEAYTPISPLPGIGSDVDTAGSAGPINYLNTMFVIFVSIIAILGVIKLMICGFQYMTSEAISDISEAKKCISGVFGGLFLVLLSVLILQTINPSLIQLTFFDTLQTQVDEIDFSIPVVATEYGPGVNIIDQGYCFTGDDGWDGFADIECSTGSIWTLEECEAATVVYVAGDFPEHAGREDSFGIDELCFSTVNGLRGTGEFCYDLTTEDPISKEHTTEQLCPGSGEDSLACEEQKIIRSRHLNFVSASPCYRP